MYSGIENIRVFFFFFFFFWFLFFFSAKPEVLVKVDRITIRIFYIPISMTKAIQMYIFALLMPYFLKETVLSFEWLINNVYILFYNNL